MRMFAHIQRKFLHLRLRPIRVFCFHQVSDVFNPVSMWDCDWISTSDLQHFVEQMQAEGYTFISLEEAYRHICKDIFRFRKYAVLTADDGSKTIENIMPWLHQKQVPLTLFINGSYLDGKTYRESPDEEYLTQNEVFALNDRGIEIGNHSWDHRDLMRLSKQEFKQSVSCNVSLLKSHPRYVPFWAYPYGTHSKWSDDYLQQNNLIPVLMNGGLNYNNPNYINRELIH